MHKLTLFCRPTCPFCHKVFRFIEEKGISLEVKNIGESSEILQELVAAGGKQQVPCLVIDGKALYESNDIIQWLSEHGGQK